MGASNVSAAKPKVGGAVYRASSSSAVLPTDTSTALTGFDSLGYISDAGLTNSNSPASTNIKAWGGDNVLTTQTDKPDTFKFKLIEAVDKNVLKTVYGADNVTGDLSSGITVNANTAQLDEAAYVIDMILRGGIAKRICIPKGQIQSIGDVVYSDGEAIGYEITILAIPDASGNTHYEYIKG